MIARQAERRQADAEFRRRAELHYNALEINLQRHLDLLTTVRTLLEATTNVGPSEFHALADDLVAAHPELQVLEWAPRIPADARTSFEAAAAREFPGFQIHDRDSSSRVIRAPARPEYYPIYLLRPDKENSIMRGFDAAAGKAVAELAQARDTGAPVLSGSIPLLQSSNDLGLIINVPVYNQRPLTTVAERRQFIRGVFRGVLKVQAVMESAWERLTAAGVDTLVLDVTDPGNYRLLYFHPSVLRAAVPKIPSEAEMRGGIHHEIIAPIAGRRWLFLFRPEPGWWKSQGTPAPLGLLLTGICFSLAFAAYLGVVRRHAEVVERTVAERTALLETANRTLSHEIAERHRTEEELRRSESRLLEAQRIGRIGSWEVDLPNNTLTWSHEVFRIFGRDSATFRPSNAGFFASVHPDDRDAAEQTSRRCIAAGAPYHIEHRIVRPDGTGRVVAEHAEMVRNELGEVVLMIGTVQDITARKQAEQRLALEHNLLEAIIESMPDHVFVKDRQGRYLHANSTSRQALEIKEMSDVIGRTDAELLPPEIAALYVADDRLVLQDGKAIVNREEPLLTHAGERRWLLTTKVPFRDADGNIAGIVGVARDITERRQADEERRVMDRKFQETQKLESLGVLAGGIAHDFNNLLTGILGNASLARMDLPAESPVQDFLRQVETSSLRAADLCKQMLAYSGKGRFVIQPVDLSVLVQESLHLLQLAISKKAVLKIDLAKGLPAVMADATQLRQIVMNLVTNASEAIGERSGWIIVRTTTMRADRAYLAGLAGIASEQPLEGNYVVLEVTDNGCGMTAETKAKIFEPFFTTKFTGRGLGLAAVLGIVRGHKGALKVYSELGKGSTFKLLLPAAATPVLDAQPQPLRPPARASGLVLVVDDEDLVRNIIVRVCKNFGFEVLSATDGLNALDIYRARHDGIDAVLLDLTMPGMDGEEAFREIRRINPHAYVLLMSGFSEQEAIAKFVGKGLAGFLQKPFTPEQLRAGMKPFFGPDGGK